MNLEVIDKFVINMGIIGPCFFIASTMLLAVLFGGTFTVGTHVLMYWEAIVYGVVGIAATSYAFVRYNFGGKNG